jgi:hypothetical protein
LEVAIAAGAAMASMSRPGLLMVKESVNRGKHTSYIYTVYHVLLLISARAAEDLPLSEGLRFEHRLYHASFSTVSAWFHIGLSNAN